LNSKEKIETQRAQRKRKEEDISQRALGTQRKEGKCENKNIVGTALAAVQ